SNWPPFSRKTSLKKFMASSAECGQKSSIWPFSALQESHKARSQDKSFRFRSARCRSHAILTHRLAISRPAITSFAYLVTGSLSAEVFSRRVFLFFLPRRTGRSFDPRPGRRTETELGRIAYHQILRFF